MTFLYMLVCTCIHAFKYETRINFDIGAEIHLIAFCVAAPLTSRLTQT